MALTPSTLRQDLKCGKGSISKGEKCHKGAATTVTPENRTATALRTALLVGGAAAAIGGVAYGVHKYRSVNKISNTPLGANSKPEQQISRGKTAFKEARGVATGTQIAGAGLTAAGAGLIAYGNKDKKKKNGAAIGAGVALTYLGLGTIASGAQMRMGLKTAEQEFTTNAEQYKQQWYGARDRAKQRAAENATSGSQGTRNVGSNKAVPNPYGDLGIPEGASDAEIKRRWLTLMRENHPDVGGDPRKAQRINAAYQEIQRRRGKLDSIYADGFHIDWEALAL